MAELFTNNATSLLNGAITVGATSLSVAVGDGALFPSPVTPDFFRCVLIKKATGDFEIVKVTTRATDVFTIERAQEGTTAVAFNDSDIVELRPTAGFFNSLSVTDLKVQSDSYNSSAATGTNSYVASLTPTLTAYVSYLAVAFIPANANTGASTLNVDALGAKTIKRLNGNAVEAGDIPANRVAVVIYDGTDFILQNYDAFVHDTGNENVAGDKTFTGASVFSNTVALNAAITSTGVHSTSKAIWLGEGAAIASVSGSTPIWATDGNYKHLTGNNTPTDFGTAPQSGAMVHITVDGTPTITNNASIICPGGANIPAKAGDEFDVIADSTTVARIVNYQSADGTALAPNKSNMGKTLASGTVSAQTSLDLDLTPYTAFPNIILRLRKLTMTTNSSLKVRLSTTGGAPFDSGASDYKYRYDTYNVTTTSRSAINDVTADAIFISGAHATSSNVKGQFDISLDSVTETLDHPTVTAKGTYPAQGGATGVLRVEAFAIRDNQQDTDAIQVLITGGGTLTFDWELYGYN
jgi:hypothetical protein